MVAFTSVHSRIHFCVKGENLPLQSHLLLEITPVVAHRILELKAETAKQDLITLRKAAMLGNPLVLFAAKLKGLIDGARLARDILGGNIDFPNGYAARTNKTTKGRSEQTDVWSGQYLPDAFRENSPAGTKTNTNGVSNSVVYPAETGEPVGEHMGEQSLEGSESGARHVSINKPNGMDCLADERSMREDGTRGEQDKRDYETAGEQLIRPSQWLKSILPEASSGWWDIRDKGNGMAIKFRWRDPDLQVITPLRITSEQFEILRKSGDKDAKSRIGEQISFGLYNLSMDPARRDKALLIARKLGIDLKDDQSQETANSTETDQ